MILRQCRPYAFAFLFTGMGAMSSADTLDCTLPATDIEAAICSDQELSDIVGMANDIGNAVGLDIKYSDLEAPDQLYQRFERLLGVLTIGDMDKLTTEQQGVAFKFDAPKKILFIDAGDSLLQDAIVVFDASNKVAYMAMEAADDAGRYDYRAVGNVLEIDSSFAPASFTQKFRNQDGCWRLIGEDGRWRDEDPIQRSINFLTGRAIFDYRDGSRVKRSFDPQVSCLGEDFSAYDLKYHD